MVYWFAFLALAVSGHALEYDADKLRDTEGVDIEAFYQGFEQYRRAGIEGNVKPLSSYFMVVGLERGFNVKFYKVNRHNFQKLDHDEKEDCCFGFTDPHRSEYPGWPMRNLLAFLVLGLELAEEKVRIVSFRPKTIRRIALPLQHSFQDTQNWEYDQSLLFNIKLPSLSHYKDTPKVVGWEPNIRQKMGPRQVTLQNILDPSHLAKQATHLNLNLMKWRQIPNLDTIVLQRTKCLLLGAGTLGCNVARTLLGILKGFRFVFDMLYLVNVRWGRIISALPSID